MLKYLIRRPHSYFLCSNNAFRFQPLSRQYGVRSYAQAQPSMISGSDSRLTLPSKGLRARELAALLRTPFASMRSVAEGSLGIALNRPDDMLDAESACLIALEHNHPMPTLIHDDTKPVGFNTDMEVLIRKPPLAECLKPRPPVVAILGHVDHGKTSLLDALRSSAIVASEAGGITQHLGAFIVKKSSGNMNSENQGSEDVPSSLTFLDTPGHAAFTAMRARGASVTDIAVLVVAADDGVKAQTIEAIHHALAANVHILVALTKVDKIPGMMESKNLNEHPTVMTIANELSAHGIMVEQIGGDIPLVPIATPPSKKPFNLDTFEETISTLATVADLRGDPDGRIEGIVLESKVEKGQGPLPTVLVQRGSYDQQSKSVVLVSGKGKAWCRVRKMTSDTDNIGPSSPCAVQGAWRGVIEAGDEVVQVESEAVAKKLHDLYLLNQKQHQQSIDAIAIHQKRTLKKGQEMKEKLVAKKKSKARYLWSIGERHASEVLLREATKLERHLDEWKRQNEPETPTKQVVRELQAVLKCDVHGTVEAVSQALYNLTTLRKSSDELFNLKLIHTGVGPVTPSDIDLLVAARRSLNISSPSSSEDDSNAHCALITFNLPPVSKSNLSKLSDFNVSYISQSVIYHLLEDVKNVFSGMLTPDVVSDVQGEAHVLQLFKIGKEVVAGCRVVDGVLTRTTDTSQPQSQSQQDALGDILVTTVTRNDQEIFRGPMKALKHFKNDVPSVSKGMECGVLLGSFRDVQVGDVIRTVRERKVKAKLE